MQIFAKILYYVFLRQLNELCQNSSVSNEMLGNNVAHFHK